MCIFFTFAVPGGLEAELALKIPLAVCQKSERGKSFYLVFKMGLDYETYIYIHSYLYMYI